MTPASRIPIASRLEATIAEMKDLIRDRYPGASFTFGEGDDPEGGCLTATVDVEDRSEVLGLYVDRLVELQVEEELPLFVIPRRTPERNAAILSQLRDTAAPALTLP